MGPVLLQKLHQVTLVLLRKFVPVTAIVTALLVPAVVLDGITVLIVPALMAKLFSALEVEPVEVSVTEMVAVPAVANKLEGNDVLIDVELLLETIRCVVTLDSVKLTCKLPEDGKLVPVIVKGTAVG